MSHDTAAGWIACSRHVDHRERDGQADRVHGLPQPSDGELGGGHVPRGTPAYHQWLWDIRYPVFAEAARAPIEGLILTMVYRREQEPCIARSVDIVERLEGEVCLVHLYGHAETVRQHVVREDRQQYGKITSV